MAGEEEEWVDDNYCSKEDCNNPTAIILLGEPLCDMHWFEHCEDGDE